MYLTVSKKILLIAKYQFKLILTANFILVAFLCLLTPFVFSARYLDSYGSSFVLERFVALIGIVLLTPLFIPEQDKNTAELVYSKRVEHSTTLIIRLGLSLLFMVSCIVVVIVVMRFCHCEFETCKFIIGTFATALFLGAIGFTFYAVTNNVVVGYLAAISYYILNYTLAGKLKAVYLFSLSMNSLYEKFWLIGLGVLLLLLSLFWNRMKNLATLFFNQIFF